MSLSSLVLCPGRSVPQPPRLLNAVWPSGRPSGTAPALPLGTAGCPVSLGSELRAVVGPPACFPLQGSLPCDAYHPVSENPCFMCLVQVERDGLSGDRCSVSGEAASLVSILSPLGIIHVTVVLFHSLWLP